MGFGDTITLLGNQAAPDNAGGTCNLPITIPAGSACIVFGFVGQGTAGIVSGILSDTESLDWQPLSPAATEKFLSYSTRIELTAYAWFFNNTTASPINTTLSFTRGSPFNNTAGRSFSLAAISIEGEMQPTSDANQWSTDVSGSGDPSPSIADVMPSGTVALAVYFSVGSSTITSTPADLTRIVRYDTLTTLTTPLREVDIRALKDWPNLVAAWQTSDSAALAYLIQLEPVPGGIEAVYVGALTEAEVLVGNASPAELYLGEKVLFPA